MLVVKGFQLMLGLCALSLIYFAAVPGVDFFTLAKMVAGSFGITILFILLYPQLRGVKKGDKVRTIGGILGTVVDIRDDEVVIKVDEATNTKLHLVRSAISKVLAEGEEASKK